MQRLEKLFKSSFIRSVTVLAGGTALAQALGILVLPLLTRIYTPSDFGTLAVFSALLGMISVIAGLRYEIAIPLPKSDKVAANLLVLSLLCSMVITIATALAVMLFGDEIAALVKAPALEEYLWLLPIGIAVTSAYNIFQYWATRKKAFTTIARSRVAQSVSGIGAQLIVGWASPGPLGLVIGQIIQSGAGFYALHKNSFSGKRITTQALNSRAIRFAAQRYDRFPKLSTFEALTNIGSIQLPIIIIASLTATAEVGFLMLAMRIMQVPMSFIGSSISQVYFSRAVDELRNNQLGRFTGRTLGTLAKIGIGPLILIGNIAPLICAFVFGKEWQRVGELIAWMTPWFVLQFLVSPISMVLHVANKTKVALFLNIYGLFIRVLVIVVTSYIGYPQYLIEVFCIASTFYYALWFFYATRIAGTSLKEVFAQRSLILILLFWIGLALVSKKILIEFLGA